MKWLHTFIIFFSEITQNLEMFGLFNKMNTVFALFTRTNNLNLLIHCQLCLNIGVSNKFISIDCLLYFLVTMILTTIVSSLFNWSEHLVSIETIKSNPSLNFQAISAIIFNDFRFWSEMLYGDDWISIQLYQCCFQTLNSAHCKASFRNWMLF